MSANTPKSRIQKGKNLENWVCERLAHHGLDLRARRSYGSGNGSGCKADIDTATTILGRAAGFECKHMDRLSVPDAWRQTRKLDSLGYEPVLVIKQTADDYDDTKVVLHLETFLALLHKLSPSNANSNIVN
jgi:hypothetical protein